MPHISLALPGVEDTVTRAAMYCVVRDVLTATGLNPDTRLVWPREVEVVANGGGSFDDPNRDAVFSSKRTVYIEVKERDNVEETLGPGGIHRQDSQPVFYEKLLGIDIAPIHMSKQVEFTIRYTTPDRTEARRWAEDMFMRVANYRDRNPHTLDYSFLMPEPLIALLWEVYALREAVRGYGDSFKEWFAANSAKNYTLKSDTTGKNQALAYNERQSEVMGYFDIGLSPDEPSYDREDGTYTVEFPYKLSYLKPVGMRAKYPILVHSQLLPSAFIDFNDKVPDPKNVVRRYSMANQGFGHFSKVREAVAAADGMRPYVEPSIDDWFTRPQPHYTLLCQMAVIPPDDLANPVVQLTDLESREYPASILKFMQESEYPYMNYHLKSLFYVMLFEEDQPIGHVDVSLDSELYLRTTYAMDKRKRYHVCVYMCVNPSALQAEAIKRLRWYPEAFSSIIQAINHDIGRYLNAKPSVVTTTDIDYWKWLVMGHGGITGSTGAGVIGSLTDQELRDLKSKYKRQHSVQTGYVLGMRR